MDFVILEHFIKLFYTSVNANISNVIVRKNVLGRVTC